MYRAGDAVDESEWLGELERAADRLAVGSEARSTARDLYLSAAPESERSKRAVVGAALYAGALVTGEQRSQSAVAEAADVSRLTIQGRWKELLADAGLDRPGW